MNRRRPLVISKIRTSKYISLSFLLTMGVLVGVLLLLFGWENSKAVVWSEPWSAGPTLLFLFGIFFVLPIWVLFRLKKVEVFDDKLMLTFPFRNKIETISYHSIESFHTRKVYYRGLKESAHLRLKNNRKIILTSGSNHNYKNVVLVLSNYIKREPHKAIHWM